MIEFIGGLVLIFIGAELIGLAYDSIKWAFNSRRNYENKVKQ